jgi:hypothetical protein
VTDIHSKPKRTDAFYFGCVREAGHYMHDVWLRRSPKMPAGCPWNDHNLDGTMQPNGRKPGSSYCPPGPQIEGHALVHRSNGWTALGFWDRSVDSRGGGNSCFIFKGDYDFDTMCKLAAEHFPTVWSRFTFPIIPDPVAVPLPSVREMCETDIAAWLSDSDTATVNALGPWKILGAIRDMIRRMREDGEDIGLAAPALPRPALPAPPDEETP